MIFNQVNPIYLQTDVDKIVNKRKQLETYIPKQQIYKHIDVKQEVSIRPPHIIRGIILYYGSFYKNKKSFLFFLIPIHDVKK